MESLAVHRALAEAPEQELAWLAENGELRHYALGEIVTARDVLAKDMLIVFTGHLVIRVDRGAGAHKIIEWEGGDVGGTLPYSRGAVPPGDVVAEEPTRLLAVDKHQFQSMTRECPTVTATLVHLMVDRARQFNSKNLQDEKLLALGKLSAGLAHELNNPASAVIRSARLLRESIEQAARTTRQLCALRLSAAQLEAVAAIRDSCITRPAVTSKSSIDRADREDAVADWL